MASPKPTPPQLQEALPSQLGFSSPPPPKKPPLRLLPDPEPAPDRDPTWLVDLLKYFKKRDRRSYVRICAEAPGDPDDMLDPGYLCNLTNGKRKNPSAYTIKRIADAYGLKRKDRWALYRAANPLWPTQ
jgi:hypothetical protein